MLRNVTVHVQKNRKTVHRVCACVSHGPREARRAFLVHLGSLLCEKQGWDMQQLVHSCFIPYLHFETLHCTFISGGKPSTQGNIADQSAHMCTISGPKTTVLTVSQLITHSRGYTRQEVPKNRNEEEAARKWP